MKKFIHSAFIAAALFILSGCAEKQENEDTVKNELRQDSKEFMESLKSVLVKEMQTAGITSAVSVCSDTAQILTAEYGAKKGIQIKRVSFKNRNPNNIPDDFEAEGLKHFQDLKTSGKLDESSELFEVVETDGVRRARYLKPIIVQAPCLSCHGNDENISPEVKQIISSRYPEDKATGYQLNDLRGTVSVTKNL